MDTYALAAVAARNDPEEWLNVLKHEATRANNAEASLREAVYVIREIEPALSTEYEVELVRTFLAAHGLLPNDEN